MNLALVDRDAIARVEGDPGHAFQAGSVSKPVAALTALRLVEDGTLELDRDVNELLVSWRLPDGDGVTLRRLLGHTAGLGVGFVPGYESGTDLPSLPRILDGEPPANTPPVRIEAPQGSGFAYSGGGYVLVQLLLEDVTGRPFAELAAELVLDPLGMADSTFVQRPGKWHLYPEQAAAGLWTTPPDLARFMLALQGRQAGAASMLEPHVELPEEGEWTVLHSLGVEPPTHMGLGLFLSERGWFSHLGGSFGFFSAIVGSCTEGQGAALMTEGGATPAFFERLLAVADEFGWEGFRCR